LNKLPEAQGHVGILGGVFHGVVDGDLVEGDLRLARPEQRLDRDGLWPR
jgi:hypothetical protein